MRLAAVDGVRRDNGDAAGAHEAGLAVYNELELPLQHVRNLLVHVRVFWQRRALVYLPEHERHVGAVDEFAAETGHDLARGDIGERFNTGAFIFGLCKLHGASIVRPMRIIELKTEKEMATIFPLVKQLSQHLTKVEFMRRLKAMRKNGYRCIAAYDGKEMVACSGFWEITRFWSTYIEPDNVVVEAKVRGRGFGVALMRWMEEEAKRLGFPMVKLDSYTTNHASHKFYHREGYIIYGFVFVKK